jgi:hypothetical protein
MSLLTAGKQTADMHVVSDDEKRFQGADHEQEHSTPPQLEINADKKLDGSESQQKQDNDGTSFHCLLFLLFHVFSPVIFDHLGYMAFKMIEKFLVGGGRADR